MKTLILMCLVALCFIQSVFAAKEKAYTENSVVKFSGDGLQITRPFIVEGPWEMQWTRGVGPMPIQVQLYQPGVSFPSLIANSMGSNGKAFQPKGGEYYLHINTMGNWVISIVELEEPK